MNYQISLASSPINDIYLHCTVHESSEWLSVHLKTADDHVTQQIKALADRVGMTFRSACRTGLITNDVKLIAPFLNTLMTEQLISTEDRRRLSAQILAVEKTLRDRQCIKDVPTSVAQEEIIRSIASPYIEALLENTQEFQDIVSVLTYAMSPENQSENLWRMWLQQHHQTNIAESVDCMKYLAMMMKGTADLSSTFMRTGAGIPILKLQRQILINSIKKLEFGQSNCPACYAISFR